MDDEQKDALRERNRRRSRCPHCVGHLTWLSGASFGPLDATHFPEFDYLVCGACGYERRAAQRKGR